MTGSHNRAEKVRTAKRLGHMGGGIRNGTWLIYQPATFSLPLF